MSKFVILLAVLCAVVLAAEAHHHHHHHHHHEEQATTTTTPAPTTTVSSAAAKKAARKKVVHHAAKKVALHVLKKIFHFIFEVKDFPDQDLDFSFEEFADSMNLADFDDDSSMDSDSFENIDEIYAH